MSRRIIAFPCGFGEQDAASMVNRIVNVYNSYAGAISGDDTDYVGCYEVNALTGEAGDAINQTEATATARAQGPTVNINGNVIFAVEDTDVEEFYMICRSAGRWNTPIRQVLTVRLVESSSSSSSSESTMSSSSSSSSSSSNSVSYSSSSSSSSSSSP